MIDDHSLSERIIRLALEEDIGLGDLTTTSVVDPDSVGKASLVTRRELVLAGLPVFKRVFHCVSPNIVFKDAFGEGDVVPADKEVTLLSGPLAALLTAERTALNFLQRMSGIATLTRQFVEQIGPLKAKILDTRKTAPGHRLFDKYAVRIGGGVNHRFGLFDGVLIKDNHIAAAGSITRAVEQAKKGVPHTIRIEVEVEDMEGAKEALAAGADIILLDNMHPSRMAEVVRMINGKIKVEASGNMTIDRIKEVAQTNVDFISVGALTHSASAADFSLEVVPE